MTKLDSTRLSLPIFCHFKIGSEIKNHFEVTKKMGSDKNSTLNHGQTLPFASLMCYPYQYHFPANLIGTLCVHMMQHTVSYVADVVAVGGKHPPPQN